MVILIAVGQSAPPVRLTARGWWQNAMERIADIMRKFTIGLIHVAMTGITKFLGISKRGNLEIWSAAMRPKQRQIF